MHDVHKDRLRFLATKLAVLAEVLRTTAEEVEAIVMKETTQRSPEFHGQANK